MLHSASAGCARPCSGANDGLVSTASLIVGVAAAHGTPGAIATAGFASLVAGAMSMAAGEYVSVSSQADLESAQIEVERRELAEDDAGERKELANIYIKRGLTNTTGRRSRRPADGAQRAGRALARRTGHLRIHHAASAASGHRVGRELCVRCAAAAARRLRRAAGVAGTVRRRVSLILLAVLGAVAARTGGARMWLGAGRVLLWGALAMAVTAGLGKLFGAVV